MVIDILKSKKETPENFVLSFLTGLEERRDNTCSFTVSYVKDDICLFQLFKHISGGVILYVNYDLIWSVLQTKFNLVYTEMQTIIKNVVESNTNWCSETFIVYINVIVPKRI